MSNEIVIQNFVNILGNGTTPTTLTAAYVASSAIRIGGAESITLLIEYITGTGETSNTLDLKIEFSHNGTDWFKYAVVPAPSSSVITLDPSEFAVAGAAAATTYTAVFKLALPAKFMRISVKETGKASNFGTAWVVVIKNGA